MKKQSQQPVLPKYRTQNTYQWLPEYGTTILGESLTVPGEAYTIEQLYERSRGGIPIDTLVHVKDAFYESDADFDTFAPEGDFDLVDAQEMADSAAETIRQARDSATKNKASEGRHKATEERRSSSEDDETFLTAESENEAKKSLKTDTVQD